MKRIDIVSIWMLFFLLMCYNLVMIVPTQSESSDSTYDLILSFDLSFKEPTITSYYNENITYQTIQIAGLPHSQDKDLPMLPVKPLKILLPYGKKIQNISVDITSEPLIFQNINPINGPTLVPNGCPSKIVNVPESPQYQNVTSLYQLNGVQYFRGFPIFFINIHPVIFCSDSNLLTYYPSLKVKITTSDDESFSAFHYYKKDFSDLKQMIDNPSIIDSYLQHTSNLDTVNDAEYLVITNEQLKNSALENNFFTLIQTKQDKGISAKLVTVEEIISNADFSINGSWGDNNPSNPFFQHTITNNFSRFDDTAARIRNYIRYAYTQLNTRYVLLGGDADTNNPDENIIPVRGLFANESGLPLIGNPLMVDEEEADIPSDIYYACLDGSFNYDMDDHFGESPDRNDIVYQDEADLIAEVYVGRAPVDSEEELANFISKTITYDSTQHPYLSNILFAGEYLGFPGISAYGGNYKDLVKPYVSNSYQINTLYDRDLQTSWDKFDLIEIINNATPHIINHDGHAYYGYNLKMHNSDIKYLTNTHPFFVYSHGCMAGGFDNPDGYDCIAEKLTVETAYGAFAVIMNARYGLGSENSLDSPSNALDISLFKAFFTENIRELGKANHFSKEDHIWHINDNGIRWVFYETNLIGDPQLQLKEIDSNPVDIEVNLIKPDQAGSIYLKDKKICSLFFLHQPIIIGGITISADAITNPAGYVHSVEFLIDGQQYHVDYNEPYTWLMQVPLKGTYTISVIAHGYYGETAEDSTDAKIWISS